MIWFLWFVTAFAWGLVAWTCWGTLRLAVMIRQVRRSPVLKLGLIGKGINPDALAISWGRVLLLLFVGGAWLTAFHGGAFS